MDRISNNDAVLHSRVALQQRKSIWPHGSSVTCLSIRLLRVRANIYMSMIKSCQRPELIGISPVCMVIKQSKGAFKSLDTWFHLILGCNRKCSTLIKILSSYIPSFWILVPANGLKYSPPNPYSLSKNPVHCNFIGRHLEGILVVEITDRRTTFITVIPLHLL